MADDSDERIVASFRAPGEAEVAVQALAQSGIAAHVATDQLRSAAAREGLPVVGTAIAVRAADEEEARSILDPIFRDERAARQAIVERCPSCGSTSFVAVRRLVIFAVAAAATTVAGFLTGEMRLFMLTLGVIGVTLLFTPNRRCTSCGERWRGKRPAVLEEEAVETPEVSCPRCGSTETLRIDRRRLSAITLIVNVIVPPFFVVFPFLTRRRCESCGNEWR